MAEGIVRFRRKRERLERDQVAARYEPDEPLDDLLRVARMTDSNAELAEARFASGLVLMVRYLAHFDDHPAQIDYVQVPPGDWLVYDDHHDLLYGVEDGYWAQWYERVNGDG